MLAIVLIDGIPTVYDHEEHGGKTVYFVNHQDFVEMEQAARAHQRTVDRIRLACSLQAEKPVINNIIWRNLD